jgi:hypothetical protein
MKQSGPIAELPKATIKRRVVQIAATDNHIYALASDGTIWNWNHEGIWRAWPPVDEIEQPYQTEIKPTPQPSKEPQRPRW